MSRDRLFTKKFPKDVSSDGVIFATRLSKLPREAEYKQTEREAYVHQVLDSLLELDAIRERLHMAEIFLKSYAVSKRWKDNYDEVLYFTYHYEMWIMNVIRFYERLLILVNSVYWLEIPHDRVTFLTVEKHPHLKDTQTRETLQKIHNALNNMQGLKNRVFHRYQYSDDRLAEISRFNLIARGGDSNNAEKFRAAAKFKMRYTYLPRKRKEVAASNENLMKNADMLFDTLEKRYILHRDGLND